jgi:thioredoxin-like negative regulator of GroEL
MAGASTWSRSIPISNSSWPSVSGLAPIPSVFAFVDGRPVEDQFQGALPEKQLREFIDRLMPNPADIELGLLAAGDGTRAISATATEHVKRAIALEPGQRPRPGRRTPSC